MYEDFKSDLKWSSQLLVEQIWPAVGEFVGGGTIIPMENIVGNELARQLDMKAGIDAFQVHSKGMRGIASRIQVGVDYRTFTIRKDRDSGAETELEKRRRALKSDYEWLYPALTIQAYVATETGPILSVGIAYTRAIMRFIEEGNAYTQRTNNAEFLVCKWGSDHEQGTMKWCGFKVHVFDPQMVRV